MTHTIAEKHSRTHGPGCDHKTPEAYHGAAIVLENGDLLTSLGDSETRVGAQVLDLDRNEVAKGENCPSVHGEATAKDEVVVIGCEDGILTYKDGEFKKIDPESGELTDSIEVISEEWKEPVDWQQPRPALFVREGTAYVTDPATKQLHEVDLEAGEVTETVELDVVPNELSGTLHQH